MTEIAVDVDATEAYTVYPVIVRSMTKVYGDGGDAVRALDGIKLDTAAR